MKKLIICSLLLAACGSNIDAKSKGEGTVIVTGDMGTVSDSGDMGTMTSPDMPVTIPDAMTTPGGPAIIELSANVMRLSEGETVVISALVTDDDGVTDIIGGRLMSGANVFGNFTGVGGSYTFNLSWDAIDQVAPINFATESTLVLTAEFVDTTDNRGTKSVTLTLHCDGASACDGSCGAQMCGGRCAEAFEFQEDPNNCGSCGNVCGENEYCEGTCVCEFDTCNGECVDTYDDPNHCGRCDNACAADETCSAGDCIGEAEPLGPCSVAAECPNGTCFDENASGYPGGICFIDCNTDADCPGTSRCSSTQGFQACAPPCNSSADCREDFQCQTAAEGHMACGPVF